MPITKTKVKKDGLQQYRVRVNFTDNKGIARQVERKVYGLAEAKQMEIQLIQEYKEKTASARMTVGELYTEYERYHANEVRKTSHDTTVRQLTRYVLPDFADVRLDKLNQPALAEWKNKLNDSELSFSTKKGAYAAFRGMLNYAVKMDYISKNPLSILGNFKNSDDFEKPEEILHYYTADEFLKYIAVSRTEARSVTDWGYYVFFSIAFYIGARKGEINALKWSDIEGNIMHIRRSISQKLKGDDIETPPKNKSSYRDIQIPKPLMEIFAEHKERQKQASKKFTENYRICGGIEPLRDTSIEKKNTHYAEKAGLPHIRIHDFRHTHASLLANQGINIQEIARRLGHSDVKTTWSTYAHLYPKEEERCLQILNKIK